MAAALIFVAAIVAALGYVLGLPVSGLAATSGAMAVVFGLAIQNTLNDMFSGLVLSSTEPFKLGDWVNIGSLEGRVVESNWRATKLVNRLGNAVIVPNSIASKASIVNLNEPPGTHGVTVVLEIDVIARPAGVLLALQLAAKSCPDVLEEPAPIAEVKEGRADTIKYELMCYVRSLSIAIATRNALYDLAHRHLTAADVCLRSPSAISSDVRAMSRRQRLLRDIDIFAHLDETDIDGLEKAMDRHEFKEGDIVYSSSSEQRVLTIVDSGVASVRVPGKGGDVEVRRMAPGDTIGQSAIVSGATLHATVVALSRVTSYSLASVSLSPILAKRAEVGQRMCEILSVHRATEESVLSPADHHTSGSVGFASWLEKGMQRLHHLVGP